MVSEETIKHRYAVIEVLDELASFLEEKTAEYSAKLDAPYSNDEPTEAELQDRASNGYMAVAYSKMHIFTKEYACKYLLETKRMFNRYIYELKAQLNEY